jgi:spore germination protein KB
MEITKTQAISLLMLYLIGTSLFMGSGGTSQNDNWIAVLVGMLLAFPIIWLYGRLHTLYPNMDLFDMLFAAFGPVIGRVCGLLYVWYAFHLGSLVLRNFGEFTKSVALTETPMLVPMAMIGLLSIWIIYEGVQVLARSALIIAVGLLLVYSTVQLFGLPHLHIHYLLPMIDKGWAPIFKAGVSTFSFPLAESVLFLCIFPYLKKQRSGYKVLLGCLFGSSLVLVLTSIRNTAMLGSDVVSNLYFPSYVAISRISIGEFLQRIEGGASVVFVSALFVKVSVCLYAACIGISKICKLSSYKVVLIQTGLLLIYQSSYIYSSMLEMVNWAYEVYQYYAFPFQVLIPVLLWGIGEWRNRHRGVQEAAPSSA